MKLEVNFDIDIGVVTSILMMVEQRKIAAGAVFTCRTGGIFAGVTLIELPAAEILDDALVVMPFESVVQDSLECRELSPLPMIPEEPGGACKKVNLTGRWVDGG